MKKNRLYNTTARRLLGDDSQWAPPMVAAGRERKRRLISPMDFYSANGSVVLRHNVATGLLPTNFKECDVMFCGSPWPLGQKIFNKRAGGKVTHDEVSEGVAQIINSYRDTLIILALGPHMLKKLPEPVGLAHVFDDIEWAQLDSMNLAWWNVEYTGPTDTLESIHQYLGETYSTMGDFFCGYGYGIFNFLAAGGQRFVASDYDSKCVGMVAKRLQELPKIIGIIKKYAE